jgi:hypothetical protein
MVVQISGLKEQPKKKGIKKDNPNIKETGSLLLSLLVEVSSTYVALLLQSS